MNGHITRVIFIGSAIASLLEKETGFLLWISTVIFGMRSKKPGFWIADDCPSNTNSTKKT
jgi:hypothetical protein